jgi:hypothetical protein
MPRQPLLTVNENPGHILIGQATRGERPELEAIIAQCIMVWPEVEAQIAVLLGFLLKSDNKAALVVFYSLRRSSAQYSAVSKAASVSLNERDQELLAATISTTKSIEKERNALVHGHFGTASNIPDGITWMHTDDYVQLGIQAQLHRQLLDDKIRQQIYSALYVYKAQDLQSILNAIKELAVFWYNLLQYLRMPTTIPNSALVEERYQRLCSQPRIAQALDNLRRKDNPGD